MSDIPPAAASVMLIIFSWGTGVRNITPTDNSVMSKFCMLCYKRFVSHFYPCNSWIMYGGGVRNNTPPATSVTLVFCLELRLEI